VQRRKLFPPLRGSRAGTDAPTKTKHVGGLSSARLAGVNPRPPTTSDYYLRLAVIRQDDGRGPGFSPNICRLGRQHRQAALDFLDFPRGWRLSTVEYAVADAWNERQAADGCGTN
jgi:hypothetical protein